MLPSTTNRLWQFPIHLGIQTICYCHYKQIVVIPNSFGNTNHLSTLPIYLVCTTQTIWVPAIRFDVYHPNHLGICQSIWCMPPKSFGCFPICLVCATQTIWVPAIRFDVYHPNYLGTCHSVWCVPPKSFGCLLISILAGLKPCMKGSAKADHELPLRGMRRQARIFHFLQKNNIVIGGRTRYNEGINF